MTEPTSPNPNDLNSAAPLGADIGSSSYSATFGPVRRKPNIATRVTAEEVRLLIDLGQSSSTPIFVGIIIVGFAFWDTAPIWVTAIVMSIQIIAQLYFNHVRAGFRADPDVVQNALLWAKRYSVGTFLSGLTWGVGGVLWLMDANFAQHAFYALVLASVSVATVITRAAYPPAVITYIGTAVTPTVIMMLLTPNPLSLATVGLSFMFLYTLVAWSRRIGRSYREAIRLRFENADLVERMARAHAATEQKRADAEEAERRAKAANRTKTEFLDILGHEVSAPLETLGAMARQLHNEPLSDVQRNLADAMSASSERLQRLFNDMIDFSQMEAQTLELKPEHFDPVDFVKTIVREMRPLATKRRLSLELDVVPGTLSTLYADPVRLRQILTNLISNGIKYTESGGVILRVQMVDDVAPKAALRFSVIDTGIGLSSDQRSHLFEGFAKGGTLNDSNGSTGGMGLGLAISDRLIRLMGGHIEVDSAPGQGSTFWFLLPCETDSPLTMSGHDTLRTPVVNINTPDRLIDHDYLYEMERDLGPEEATDRMVEALRHILSLYEAIEQARRESNTEALQAKARALQSAAEAIGLIAIAAAARSIDEMAPTSRGEEVPRLYQRISETWGQLARAYPGIALNEPDA